MGSGVSIWWATPADPERHFADHELTDSDRYHRRLYRVGFVSLGAKVLSLLLAAVVLGRWAERAGDGLTWSDDLGWLASVLSWRVAAGTIVTVLALRLPAVAADAWFEYRFRHGREDHRPAPIRWFALTSGALTAAIALVVLIGSGTIYRTAVLTDRWPFIAAGLVVIATAGFSFGERWLRQLGGSAEEAIEDDELLNRLDRLASSIGLSGIHFATSAPPEAGGVVQELASNDSEVPNAYSVGLGPNRRVVMTGALLEEPETIADFVVAHELTHVSKRHVLTQTAVAVAAALMIIAAVAFAQSTGQPWQAFGFEPTDPLGLPVTALLILLVLGALGPASGWLSRAQERAADAGAVTIVGVPRAADARRLYVATTADLRPPVLARIYAPHPAPAERLEYLARQRRATHDERHVSRETR